MIQKMTTLIFRSKILHDELINVVQFVCSDLLFVFQKIRISALSINTRTSLLKSAKASSYIFFLYISVGGIGKLFKLKTRIFHLILNSRCVFKIHQYFMVLKSNFGAFFQDMFFLRGIMPNHLRLMS